jgi:hypothetical protein
MHKLAAAMAGSADAGERSRGLFILGASSEPREALPPLSRLCRESPSARASEMLGCMHGFLGEFLQVRAAPRPRASRGGRAGGGGGMRPSCGRGG